jgi:hypothetical protein
VEEGKIVTETCGCNKLENFEVEPGNCGHMSSKFHWPIIFNSLRGVDWVAHTLDRLMELENYYCR